MWVAEKLGLTNATQTTFATAVSEIARSVIEHTDGGVLHIGLEQNKTRYTLVATVTYDKAIQFNNGDAGYYYAQKLVPEFIKTEEKDFNQIEMKLGLPRSLKLDAPKVMVLKKSFDSEEPLNAYEEIKLRNVTLNRLAVEQQEELRQSRIIDEQKTEFISIASHEIKTPITIIKAYTQIAKGMGDQCSDQVKNLLNKVDNQTNKLLSLIHQLLDITRIENGNLAYQLEEIEINSYVSEVLDIIKLIHPNHTFTTSLCMTQLIKIDKVRMEQVFSNLIGNAAKYSAKNTKIEVSCSIIDEGFIRIAVSDQGLGMSEETTKSIFNKFYRDKDVVQTHSGLGMGLYIASKIIVDHGGTIWVDSKENKGSTFYFTIPLLN
jgi:signal transduction histidine kinase